MGLRPRRAPGILRRMSPWRDLLLVATRCPSPHNVQPWRVRVVDDRHAELWIEKRRTLPREDTSGSFILLTMGMFLDALRLVAAHRGLRLAHEPVHPPDWYRAAHLEARTEERFPFARMTLEPGPGLVPEYPLEVFLRRRTSRLPLHPQPVPDTALERIAAVAARHGQRLGFTRDPARIEQALALDAEAVAHDFNEAGYHDELTSWFRYDERASMRERDGLDARCMNATALELRLLAHAPWILRAPVLGSVMRGRYRRRVGPVPTLAWLAGDFWSPGQAFDCGRALLAVWLEVTALGLVLHPFGNLVTHRPVAARHEALHGESDLWLVFKLGSSPEPPESRRLPVEAVLL